MVSKFPLIEALGVQVHFDVKHKYVGKASLEDVVNYVSASDLEAALAEAPTVRIEDANIVYEATQLECFASFIRVVRPKDTAESLLRELAQYSEHGGVVAAPHGWLERARKLLEDK